MSFEPGTALEFFAGIGLARMGLERAGWRVIFANDIDPLKKDMHAGHWGEDPTYLLGSVFDLNPQDIPSAEMAWASFPCVDLSLAGNRAGLRGHSSSAYWGFHDALNSLGDRRPPIVVLENVPGLMTTHAGRDMASILAGLADLGYEFDLIQLSAEAFVPQSRPRVFVIAGKASAEARFRQPEVRSAALRPTSITRFISEHSSLPWRLLDTLTPPQRSESLDNVLEDFPDEADVWWDDVGVARLIDRMSPKHRARVTRLADAAILTHATVYRRVRPTGYMAEVRSDGIAGCLRTARGGSSRQFVLRLGRGNVRARAMTAIEYGRLQGAADFKIRVPPNQAISGFGDAVCVPVVDWLMRSLVSQLRPGRAACVAVSRQLELVDA